MERGRATKMKVFRKLALIIAVSVVCGILLELAVSEIQYRKAGAWKGETVLTVDSVVTDADDSSQEDITLDIPQGLYVNKLVYYYSAVDDFTARLSVYEKNGYDKFKKVTITDDSVGILNRSVINIHKSVSQVTLTVSNEGNVEITGFEVDNSYKFNPIRAFFFVSMIYLALFLILFRERYAERIEWAFLNVSLILGALFIVAQPFLCSGWDEHIHFRSCYELAEYGDQKKLPYSVQYLYQYQEDTKERIGSYEENQDLARELNNYQNQYDSMRILPQDITNIRNVGYVFQALFLKIGLLFHFDFTVLWIFGKFANVLLYSVVMFFAIRKTPVAKVLMCVTGLLPMAVYISSSYTYDVTVTAFLTLAAAIIIKAYYGAERNFTPREQILFIISVVAASAPKVVYIPFVILALFLPANRYARRKTVLVYRCALLLSAAAIIGLEALPTLTGSSSNGDSRGGSTSVSEQVRLIKHYPYTYIGILAREIFGNILSYLDSYSVLAHLGEAPCHLIMTLGLVFVWLTDRFENGSRMIARRTSVRLRGLSLIVCFLIICLIWTALYVQFTTVGSSVINGVQPRYFLPVLWLGLLSTRIPGIQTRFSKSIYQSATILACASYLLTAVYFTVLRIHNL